MAATFAVDHALESTHDVSFDLAELTKMYDFTGLVVAVTGGAGILGSEMARALAGCGAQVAVLDLNIEPAKTLIASLGHHGKQISLHQCDVLNRESIAKAAQDVVAQFGKIDCLINGAGGNKATATTGPDLKFFDLPADALRWVFDLNILGTMLPCQAFGKIMAEQGHGTILNISSMNSFRPLTRIPAYSGAKAAVSLGRARQPRLISIARPVPPVIDEISSGALELKPRKRAEQSTSDRRDFRQRLVLQPNRVPARVEREKRRRRSKYVQMTRFPFLGAGGV